MKPQRLIKRAADQSYQLSCPWTGQCICVANCTYMTKGDIKTFSSTQSVSFLGHVQQRYHKEIKSVQIPKFIGHVQNTWVWEETNDHRQKYILYTQNAPKSTWTQNVWKSINKNTWLVLKLQWNKMQCLFFGINENLYYVRPERKPHLKSDDSIADSENQRKGCIQRSGGNLQKQCFLCWHILNLHTYITNYACLHFHHRSKHDVTELSWLFKIVRRENWQRKNTLQMTQKRE